MYSNLVPVPARRHPMQVLVAFVLLVSGVAVLVGGPTPGSVSSTLPGILVYVWAGILAVGGSLVVAAAIVPPVTALYLEAVAHLPLCLGCLAYASAVTVVAGLRGLVIELLLGAFAVAFGIRFWQTLKTLRLLGTELRRRSR